MPMYEFECPRGHRSEDLVSIGTKSIECPQCTDVLLMSNPPQRVRAERVLSPTPTTFRFADVHRKRT